MRRKIYPHIKVKTNAEKRKGLEEIVTLVTLEKMLIATGKVLMDVFFFFK